MRIICIYAKFFVTLSRKSVQKGEYQHLNTTNMKRLSTLLIAVAASVFCVMTHVQSAMAQQAPSISIDGDFSDWQRVPEAYLAEDTVDRLAEHENLYRIRFCSDAENVYFYAEFSNEIAEGVVEGQTEGETTTNYVVNVVDLFLDTDNSSETGYKNYLWTDGGADYILEGMPHEDFGGLYAFSGGTDQEGWNWEEVAGSAAFLEVSKLVTLENGHAAIEGSVARSILSIPSGAESIKVGVTTQNASWTESGVLPESILDVTGAVVRGNMLEVPLYYCEGMTWGLSNMVTAHLDCKGNLYIWGEGEMPSYSFGSYAPWHDKDYVDQVEHLYLDSAITKVGSYAFYDCIYLQSVELGSKLEEISWNAFYGCTGLKTITIPDSVKMIDNNAFGECSGLEEMICLAMTPPDLGNTVFLGMSSSAPLYVPAEALEAYTRSGDWEQYPGKILSLDERKGEAIVVINGDTIKVDPEAPTTEIDINGDGTLVYDTEENTLTLTGLDVEDGEVEGTVIEYSGTETLTIVLTDESSITADVVISSSADVIITGDGTLVAEGVVPIVGTANASITFDGVNMIVRSIAPSEEAIRRIRKTRWAKRLDETGGPALSGFGSAEFNKVDITPSDAMYGAITSGSSDAEFAMYVMNGLGEQEVLTEFTLTAKTNAVEDVRAEHKPDPSKAMYNVLGVQVGAEYKGVVIQDGQKFMVR